VKPFLDQDFLLDTPTAVDLYHGVAARQPILDYHCHLSPQQIAVQDGSVPGKMQFGSGWWFLDQLDGMRKQLDALSNMGLLSRFVGMLTDSRSFLSFSRHEYFRRLLCNVLGTDVERGLLPNDRALLGGLVEDVCFRNARAYLKFDKD
jgi:glucuronate isomerase